MAVTKIRDAQAVQSIDLTSEVTGTLPVPNGGTGSASLTLNNVLLGNGTGAVQTVAPGAAGTVLKSTGSTWAAGANAYQLTSVTSSATPSVTVTGLDMLYVSALAVAITGITVSGSPQDGWRLLVLIKDNGTSRAFAAGASFQNSDDVTAPTATTVGKYHLLGYVYFAAVSKYVLTAKLTFA